jgi:hypothetical protein
MSSPYSHFRDTIMFRSLRDKLIWCSWLGDAKAYINSLYGVRLYSKKNVTRTVYVRCLSLSCVQLSTLCTKTTSSSKNELGESYALPLPLSPGKYLVAKVYNHVLRRMLCFCTSLLCTKLLCQRQSCSAQNLFFKK